MKFFTRWAASGRYRLPMPVLRLLERRLTCRRNQGAAERAHRLAGFLAQMHAATGREFPLDRRALFMAHGRRKGAAAATKCSPDNPGTDGVLDLTLDQIRAAIEILEEIGFVARVKAQAGWKQAAGAWHRRALAFVFGQIFERVFLFCRKSPIDSRVILSSVIKAKETRERNLKTIFGGVAFKPAIAARPPAPPRPLEINPALERVLARLGSQVAAANA